MKKTIKKRAFISAIAMLIVSAIVLTSSTFAWFSMAKKVEVESMKLSITSPEGIQLSANASAWTTTITKAELDGSEAGPYARFNAYAGNTNYFPAILSPASSAFAITTTSMPVWYSGSIDDHGMLNLSRIPSDNDPLACYVSFDLFVKVEDAQKVSFSDSTITCDTNTEAPACMRIAVVNCGQLAEGANDAAKASLRPTQQKKIVPGIEGLRNNAIIYEVDPYTHTISSGLTNGVADPTKRLPIIAEGSVIPGKVTAGALTANHAPTGSAVVGANSYDDDMSASNAYFNAYSGITKIRVYIWVDGQDADCANDVAGNDIDVNFVLSIA